MIKVMIMLMVRQKKSEEQNLAWCCRHSSSMKSTETVKVFDRTTESEKLVKYHLKRGREVAASTNTALPAASSPVKSHSQTGPRNRRWWLVPWALCVCVHFCACVCCKETRGLNEAAGCSLYINITSPRRCRHTQSILSDGLICS